MTQNQPQGGNMPNTKVKAKAKRTLKKVVKKKTAKRVGSKKRI